ncbi:2-dehydro-3-deoxygalactonokinase [Luteimonas sp. Y-2-2-4F]|nr:2-dehydro-3-deoxygalactonokinase [Luteimonas sp. Y-2-2-4F]
MIAVDWGTTALRAWRLDAAGAIVDARRGPTGALDARGRHAAALAACIDGWDDARIVLCGMVGARNGWVGMPYVDCPASAADLAAALRDHADPALPGRRLLFVPGVADRAAPDVMRGEEVQVCGLPGVLDGGRHLVALPGTHAKWVRVEDGRIISVATAMTGELYALLRRHGTLADLMTGDDAPRDRAAFEAGLRQAGADGGLPHQLFGLRARALFGRIDPAALPSWLSGLLIGHEIRGLALPMRPEGPVHLVGGDALVDAYAHALALAGIDSRRHDETAAARGLWRLAQLRA